MAITVSTRPDEYSNSSIFITTTDVAEDSSHVNTRIDAELYVDGVVIAKKSKPKGITTFDFTDILRSKIQYLNPIIDDALYTTILDPGKSGSNLITGWTESGATWDTWTVSGANWTEVITAAAPGGSTAYTNNISVTNGYIYVILYNPGANSPSQQFSLSVKTTPANGNIMYSNTDATEVKRFYFQPRTTGTIALEFTELGTGGQNVYSGTWLMYKLNATDWWVPYYVKFTEYWEDATGVTTAGTSSTESSLLLFFKSESTSFSSYICYDSNGKFLKADGYNIAGSARTYSRLKTPATGGRSSAFNFHILDKRVLSTDSRHDFYNAAGVYQNYNVSGVFTNRYCPINYVTTRENVIATYPQARIYIIKAVATPCTEELRYDAILNVYNDNIHLIWEGVSGFSEYTFSYDIQKSVEVSKDYYKDSNNKNRLIKDSVISTNIIKAYTPIGITEYQLNYISEILKSPLVYWLRAADDLVRVTVKSDNMITKNDIELTPFQIEIEW